MATGRGGGPEGLVGSVVADRYRLVQHLSTGANTLIFDAEDVDSHRTVTVKLLRPDLTVSAGFRDRFESTLRTASTLSHPNIAAIFDWGVAKIGSNATGYVVIERLTGGSLRDVYDRGRRLSPSQALALGLEVCRGLDHAHRRGFVHGELSPSKLVFGDDRRVRIVDVGLSSLLAEHMWTDPSSVPTHVARYASPEQALSLPIDGTTDVYALCLCLVEGVTGVLPFAADSTVSTLSARIGRLMPVSADLGPLASVLERAGRPEAAERATAAQFGRALVQTAEKLPRPEPLPLFAVSLFDTPTDRLRAPEDPTGGLTRPEPAELLVVTSDEDASETEPSRSDPPESDPSESDPPESPAPVDEPVDASVEELDHEPVAAQVAAPAEAPVSEPADGPDDDLADEPVETPVAEPADGPDDDLADEPADEPLDLVVLDVEDDPAPPATPAPPPPVAVAPAPERPRRSSLVRRILVPVLILVAIAALVALAVRLFSTPSYEVPDLAGVEQAAALVALEEFGWDVSIEPGRSDDEPRPGLVIRTVPGAGERLGRGEPFLLVVSEGPEFRVLPDLVGRNFVEAETVLTDLALVPIIEEQHDEDMPRGGVTRWAVAEDPDAGVGDLVLPGTEVLLVVSLGPAPRTVPDLGGATTSQASATLAGLRLDLVETDPVFDDVVPPGVIARQDPAPGTEVPRDTTIEVAISLGPDLVILPDLSGTDFAEAQRRLAEQDLIARLEFGASDGTFVSASVDGAPVTPGEPVRRGAQVDLVFL